MTSYSPVITHVLGLVSGGSVGGAVVSHIWG